MLAGLAEPPGLNTLLHGSLKEHGHPLTASLSGIHRLPNADQPIRLGLEAENIHLFGRTSGQHTGHR